MQERYLRDSDAAVLSQLLLGLLAGVWVRKVRVKIFIQDLRRLFAEVTPLAPVKTEEQVEAYTMTVVTKSITSRKQSELQLEHQNDDGLTAGQ